MSRNYKFHNPEGIYFVSFATVFWISVFIRGRYTEILIESLKYYQDKKGLLLYGYCIMPNHIHLIYKSGIYKPSEFLRDLKKICTLKIIASIKENKQESRKEWMLWMFKHAASKDTRKSKHKFWQYHNKPIEIWSNNVFEQKLKYIHFNPVEEGFVEKPYEWKYSSARNYMLNDDSIIKIELI